MPTWELGRNFRVYDAAESTYGTAPTLASADAIRHIGGSLAHNPNNFQNAPTRLRAATLTERRVRRETAEATLRGEFWPSGTINTVPDHDAILTDAMGSKTNVVLSTTVSAAPAPTSTVFTVASSVGLVVGGAVLVNATSGGRQVRVITVKSGDEITVAPPLSAAPTSGDSVKSCIVYSLANLDTPVSHTMAAYGINRKFEVNGWILDKLMLEFDSNGEIVWEVSGPAKTRLKGASVQAEPVAFTTAGTAIPSGLTGYLRLGSAAEEFVKAKFELMNGHALQNNAYGTSTPQGAFRKAQFRQVRFSVTMQASDDSTILDAATARTQQAGILQTGLTEGQIIGVYFPKWEIDTPPGHDLGSVEDYQEEYSGTLLGTSTGNDEVKILIA
jgi:hypothetical protein